MLDFENKNNGDTSDANVISGKLDAVTSGKLKRRYSGSKIDIVATIVMLMAVCIILSACSSAGNDVETVAEIILAEEIDEEIAEEVPISETIEEDEEIDEIEETFTEPVNSEPTEEEIINTFEKLSFELALVFYDYPSGSFELAVSDIDTNKMISFLVADRARYDIIPLESVSRDYRDGYSHAYYSWYDMDQALASCGELFNAILTEVDIDTYNALADEEDNIAIDGDSISFPYLYLKTWDMTLVQSYSIEEDCINLSVYYEDWYDSKLDNAGTISTVFRANPESFCGYSFESMNVEPLRGNELNPELAAVPLAGEFKAIIRTVANFGLGIDTYGNGESEIIIDDLDMIQICWFLHDSLYNNIFYPLGYIYLDDFKTEEYPWYYTPWYEMEPVLEKCGNFLGKTITENDLRAFNDSCGYDAIAIVDDKIAVMWHEEPTWVHSSVESYSISEDNLTVNVYYELGDDGGPYRHGNATAVFRKNDNSCVGYTPVSVTADTSFI